MKLLRKIFVVVFLTAFFVPQTWALDAADFQKKGQPAGLHAFDVFSLVPLYYLESPPGVKFIEKDQSGSIIRFFLDPQAAETSRFQNEKSSGKPVFIKKIPMPAVLRSIYAQSQAGPGEGPRLLITEGPAFSETFFYYLSDIPTGGPYFLHVKGKKTIPAFVSLESAESAAKIITVATSQNLQVEKKDLAGFLDFLNHQDGSGLPVRVFAYASRPEYQEVRPMTFGVFSSYLLGSLLVLFLFWAITFSAKRRP